MPIALERMTGLKRLCGYVENGSNTTVSIHQDDATKNWIVYVGKKWYYGNTFGEAIDKAIADNPDEQG